MFNHKSFSFRQNKNIFLYQVSNLKPHIQTTKVIFITKKCLSYSEVNQNPAMMTVASGYCMDWNVEERSKQKNGWMESEGGEEK